MGPSLLLSLLLTGCSGESTSAVWLQGAGFEWKLFNHRVSHLQWGVDGGAPTSAIVGGTSTTGVSAELDETCDPDTCEELPFRDESLSFVRWVQASSERTVFATGTGELLTGVDGASTELSVALPFKAKGTAQAVLAGLTLSTDQALSGGDACYDPAFGWHPRRIQVELGEAVLADDRLSVTVPLSAGFEAGNSLEDIRQCVDEVNEQAQVLVSVEVVVIVGDEEDMVAHKLDHGMTYSYGDGPATPDEQPAPDPADRAVDIDFDAELVGWQAMDWRFHVDDAEARGAYLRSLSFDADGGMASGHATNYSPITQITGFDYAFQGRVLALSLEEGGAEGERVEAMIPAELDEQGQPVVFELASE